MQYLAALDAQVDLQAGIADFQLAKDLGHGHGGGRLVRAHAQHAVEWRNLVLPALLELAAQLQHALRVLEDFAAGGRQLYALLASAEKRDAQDLLELLHACRDRRLADEQMLGRRIDGAERRGPVEGLQLPEGDAQHQFSL
ncbi:hypothetical protein D9M72_598570 [compost metagenome]